MPPTLGGERELVEATNYGELDRAAAREQALRRAREARSREARGGFWERANATEADWFESLADHLSGPETEEGARRTNDLARVAEEARNECVRRARELDPMFFGIRARER